MSHMIHRFNNNSECNAFMCGMGAAEPDDPGAMGPFRQAIDVIVGDDEDGTPFYGVLVETDDGIDTEEGEEKVFDHREHVGENVKPFAVVA